MREFEEQDRQYENMIAETYNEHYHKSSMMKSYDSDFAKFVSGFYRKGDRVLDLGCGSASLWPLWKDFLPENGHLVGMDLSDEMITECKKAFPNDTFVRGSIFEMPFDSGSFDLIIISSVLHHIPDEHLPEVFEEVKRVLDEHGTIVGREPVSTGRLGDTPGWLSGAMMSFRHMVYRLTKTRGYPEPEIHGHHHAYNPKKFATILKEYFSPKSFSFRHPVSSYVSRCENSYVTKITTAIDKIIDHTGGHEFYYSAVKNYCDFDDIAFCVDQELKSDKCSLNKKEFLALLHKASELIEKEING